MLDRIKRSFVGLVMGGSILSVGAGMGLGGCEQAFLEGLVTGFCNEVGCDDGIVEEEDSYVEDDCFFDDCSEDYYEEDLYLGLY